MTILLAGGAGYIGSHVASVLLEQDHHVIIIDDLSNSTDEVILNLRTLHPNASIEFIEGDVSNKQLLIELFANQQIDGVIHLAGYKSVKESVEEPLKYYRNNLAATLALLEIMSHYNVTNLVFSSSATVYGDAPVPYVEDMTLGNGITHPYGKTKFMIEQILQDICVADQNSKFVSLRYFNPIGAHPSGLLGESPTDTPNNLMPYIQNVASGKQSELHVFGNDYPTPDGSCIRDYVHVMDVAEAHVAALNHSNSRYSAYNIGTGKGISVLELIEVFEEVNQLQIPYTIDGRRSGDIAEFYADVSLAASALNWRASRSIEDACRDSWHFTKKLMESKS